MSLGSSPFSGNVKSCRRTRKAASVWDMAYATKEEDKKKKDKRKTQQPKEGVLAMAKTETMEKRPRLLIEGRERILRRYNDVLLIIKRFKISNGSP